MSNFYLYRPDGSTRHQLIPWDRDLSFSAVDAPILQRAQENVIFRRALLEEDLSALYQQVLLRCAQVATQGQWLEREIARTAALIRPAVLEDPVKPFSNEVFDREVSSLRGFARSRSGNVIRQVRRLP